MQTQDRLRVVLVGCGGISGAWLSAVRQIPSIEMVGFADIREEAARKRAEEFGWTNAAVGSDFIAVLDKTRPDAIFDCTLPEIHKQVTVAGLQRGCHVLGEKPMATSMDDARAMIAAADRAGKIYAVTQTRRYDANVRRLKHFLDSHTIGRLHSVYCDFFLGPHFGGFRERMRHVLIVDMAIHTFDAARLLTGADPVAVYCKEWNPDGSWFDHDASAVAIFEMTNGVVFTYRGSWCAVGLNTTWESQWRILADQGSAWWDGAQEFKAQRAVEQAGFLPKCEDVPMPSFDAVEKVGGHAGAIREFVRCVRTGDTPEIVCTDNIKSLAMVLAAVESSETGKRVEIHL